MFKNGASKSGVMTGSTQLLRMGTLLKTVGGLSRGMRTHMGYVDQATHLYQGELVRRLDEARRSGSTKQVRETFEEAEKTVMKKGLRNLFKAEREEEGAMLKAEDELDHIPFLMVHLGKVVKGSKLDDKVKYALQEEFTKCLQYFNGLFSEVKDRVKAVYRSTFAQAKGAKGENAHRIITENNGPLMLMNAMRDAYHIRTDVGEIRADVSATRDICNKMEEDLKRLEKSHEHVKGIVQNLERDEANLERNAREIVAHVRTLFKRFVIVMQAFTTYYFIIRKDESGLTLFLLGLERSGFPPEDLARLKKTLKKDDADADEVLDAIMNVMVNMRHPIDRDLARTA